MIQREVSLCTHTLGNVINDSVEDSITMRLLCTGGLHTSTTDRLLLQLCKYSSTICGTVYTSLHNFLLKHVIMFTDKACYVYKQFK